MATKADIKKEIPRNGRRGNGQGEYILLVLFALSTITLALVMAILFTQSRLGEIQRQEPAILSLIEELKIKPDVEIDETTLESMNYWPSDQFPSVPQFEAGRYRTSVENMRAVVAIPPEDVLDLKEYTDSLSEAGAAIHVRTDKLIVLIQAGTEIQIVPSGARPTITLCGEPQITWRNDAHPEMVLPESGKLVAVKEGITQDSLVFTLRGASIGDVMMYLNQLNDAGWRSENKLNYKNNTLLATFVKGDLIITVDYYAGGDNYQIKLETNKAADAEDSAGQVS